MMLLDAKNGNMLEWIMSTRRNSRHRRCPRCRIHEMYCFCVHIKPIEVKSTLSLIVHIRELKLTSNTAAFLKEMMPATTHFDVRGRMNEPLQIEPILERPGTPFFLYPDENALELDESFKAKHPGPYHLIVPDGNWHQARKVHQREPLLTPIQTVKIPAGITGEYQLRRAPQPHFVSTYEAVAHALAVLEGPHVRDQLMAFFRIFVKSVLHSRNRFHDELELGE